MESKGIKASWIRSNLLFTWIFHHLNRSADPELINIPSALDLESSLKQLEINWDLELKKPKPSFFKALLKLIWPEIIFCSITHSISTSQKAFISIMIKEIIDYLNEDSKDEKKANLLIAGIVIAAFIMITVKSNAEYRILILIGKIKGLVSLMISKKSMRINSNAIEEGKILNLLSADLELFDLFMYCPYLIGSPINIIVVGVLLKYIISSSALIGLAISIGHMPVIFILAIAGGKTRAKINQLGDRRIKLLTNLIEGIKVFKFFAWELPYVDKICEFRKKEINQRYVLSNINGIMVLGC